MSRYPYRMTDPLDFPDGELPDDDPDVIAGMARLAVLRAAEHEVPTIPRDPERTSPATS